MTYDLDEHKSNNFIQKVTPQKKRVRQLKFSIYTRIKLKVIFDVQSSLIF